jgi:hypothetical protein
VRATLVQRGDVGHSSDRAMLVEKREASPASLTRPHKTNEGADIDALMRDFFVASRQRGSFLSAREERAFP